MQSVIARLSLASTFAAALVLASATARAQGTDEEREACAPDAIKLCEKTIPDVPKTTACMKRHYAQLSPRCRKAFDGATGGGGQGTRAAKRSVTPAPPASTGPGDDDSTIAARPEAVPGLRAYEAQIRKACADGLVDDFTCRNTLDVLRRSE